ncbi:AraC family transcriptional regulator [Nocardioides iriomotensis]|uniref:AraC family transcriptional regulator n=1 Tax=Nocardioides iriomotensis TaxID=715784 RepID=A0A4Q5IZK9_9ACTN|nr:AraC family transcriptional regulator [Nocardioides iriomotensis]RYU11423.1 AraC family transcriptional regulator [Nocardioides iriomotensis]
MLDRFNEAMAYVEAHLEVARDGDVDPRELARVAATSEYHFRRMFSALAGMPLSEYVRRRRMTLAGPAVVGGDETLLDIAVRYGYESGEGFARAFRAVHGVGPGEARREGAALVSQPPISFRLVVEGSSSMRYRIVEKPAFGLVGFRARVPLVHEGPNAAIMEFVRGLDPAARARVEALADQEPAGLVSVSDGIADDRAEGSELDYWQAVVTGAEAPDGVPGVERLEVPAGTWVVFEGEGPVPEAFQHLWRDAYVEWFPSHPYRTRPGPELLSTRLDPDGTRGTAALWLPVEPTDGPPETSGK